MRLCSYVVMTDTGFAPNPFGEFCTLAACTPNHQAIKLEPGDWVLGNSSVKTGNRIIYVMRVSEVLDFDDYFRAPRFQHKKPIAADWQSRCGDNIYCRDGSGDWNQGLAFFHTQAGQLEKDTKRPRVFISDHFYYFGENAPEMPDRFRSLLRRSQGCQCNHSAEIRKAFISWLTTKYAAGTHGLPRDRDKAEHGQIVEIEFTLKSHAPVNQGRC